MKSNLTDSFKNILDSKMKVLFAFILLFSCESFSAVTMQDVKTILESEFQGDVRSYSTQDFGRARYNKASSVIIPVENHRQVLLKIRKKLPQGAIAYIGTCLLYTSPSPRDRG